jgi:phospholipid transport system substrate-binding protein
MRHRLVTCGAALLISCASGLARAADEAPDAVISRLSAEVVELAKEKCVETGDVAAIMALVDRKVIRTSTSLA